MLIDNKKARLLLIAGNKSVTKQHFIAIWWALLRQRYKEYLKPPRIKVKI